MGGVIGSEQTLVPRTVGQAPAGKLNAKVLGDCGEGLDQFQGIKRPRNGTYIAQSSVVAVRVLVYAVSISRLLESILQRMTGIICSGTLGTELRSWRSGRARLFWRTSFRRGTVVVTKEKGSGEDRKYKGEEERSDKRELHN